MQTESKYLWPQAVSKMLEYCAGQQAEEDGIILVHVDDLLPACKIEKRMAEIKEELAKQFVMKDVGEAHHFLGVKIIQNLNDGEVWIGFPAFTRSVLKRFGVETSAPVTMPVDLGSKSVKAVDDNGGLLYSREEMKGCVGYSDADWAG